MEPAAVLRTAAIEFFRTEVDRRYTMEYLRSVPGLEEEGLLSDIDQRTVDRVKDFFREVLYPTGEERATRDASVEEVMAILGDRGRILALLPKMPGFIFRHGAALLTATRAGMEVLSAFRLSTRIESMAVEHLFELCDEEGIPADGSREIPQRLLRRALARVPGRRVAQMMEHLRKLTRLGMQRGTIAATDEVLRELRRAVASDEERHAIDYALWVLSRLDEEVEAHSRPLMERLLTIAERVEEHYLGEIWAQEG